ncbi:hypothetical protein BKA65DRAFT_505505 [Rhexocercosporidium sp. MPI-PUGE-AT-0058]|nr:hypothetical protein BKA65DRAFT_505505 [Rhexocercosporidium sp. MPI-PUGE-AT-0058]
MMSLLNGRQYCYLLIACAILWTNCKVEADSIPNYFTNSTQIPIAGTVTESSTITSGVIVTELTTCYQIVTGTSIITTAYGNTTVFSTTTISTTVTLPPSKPPRNIIRAPFTTSGDANGMQVTVTRLTTITSVTTFKTCGFTISQTVIVVTTQTQKITVDQLVTEIQTIYARGPSSTTTTSSTLEAIPPAQQVTTTSSKAANIPPAAQGPTTTRDQNAPAPTDASPTDQSTTTINGIPFTISSNPSNTAVIINGATILPGQPLTTAGVEFSNGPTGLEIITATSVGVIVASIFGIPTGIVIGGNTLTSGGALTLSGTTYILPTGGTVPAILTGTFQPSMSLSVPNGGDGGSSVTATGTAIAATPSYIQAGGASRVGTCGLSAVLIVLCVGVIQADF